MSSIAVMPGRLLAVTISAVWHVFLSLTCICLLEAVWQCSNEQTLQELAVATLAPLQTRLLEGSRLTTLRENVAPQEARKPLQLLLVLPQLPSLTKGIAIEETKMPPGR